MGFFTFPGYPASANPSLAGAAGTATSGATSNNFHLSLTKQNSLGTSPYSVATSVNLTSGGTSVTVLRGSSTGDIKSDSYVTPPRRSFVNLIPAAVLGRASNNSSSSSSNNNSEHIKMHYYYGSEAKIQSLFAKYKDGREDAILSEGIEALCRDLDLRPDEFRVLVLAWKCNLETMCRFSRAEFVSGLRALKTDSLKGLAARLPEIVTEVLEDPGQFKDLYRFTFRFGLEAGQKVLPVEMAVSLWELVFRAEEADRGTERDAHRLLSRWICFLRSHPGQIRGIPRDTWNMFLNLQEAVGWGCDLSSYDDNEAWPSLFDDFVEFENDLANQNMNNNEVMKKEGEDD